MEFTTTEKFNNASGDGRRRALHTVFMNKGPTKTDDVTQGDYWETQKRLFGIRVRTARIAAGYKGQGAFGEDASWSESRQNNYELGKRWPEPWDLMKMRVLTGCTGDWLQYGDTRGMDYELLERLVTVAFQDPWVIGKYPREDIESAVLPGNGVLAMGLRAAVAPQ